MHLRPIHSFLVLALLAGLVISTGTAAAAPPDPTPQVSDATLQNTGPARSKYGPTAAAPSGGVLGPHKGGARWQYRGVLGNLDRDAQIVAPKAAPLESIRRRAPLTGLPAGKLNRPAVIVKVDNVAPAKPQTGINQADIVYEELVESGQTRLAAVFHSQYPNVVGPVRSGRSTDVGIVSTFDRPILAYSGANNIFTRLLRRSASYDRGHPGSLGLYWRGGGRPAPHNLYTNVGRLRASVGKVDRRPEPQFAYRAEGEALHRRARSAASIQLRYTRGANDPVRYEWSNEAEGWLRWQGGRAHLDSAGVQVAPKNVVVQIVRYVDSGLTDKFGETLWEGVSTGRGNALIFTDGHVIEAKWTRSTLKTPTTFTDRAGNHIELTPGNTWVSLIAKQGVTFNAYSCRGLDPTLFGTPGDDLLIGTPGDDIIAGAEGNDRIKGRGGNDIICGGAGDDVIWGHGGKDRLYGQGGNDVILGGRGADRAYGGGGADEIRGQGGRDILAGNGGPDVLVGLRREDTFRSGVGDTIRKSR